MVVKTIQKDVFETEAKHIAFAINKEGLNDSGFAGQVSRRYWNELANCGEHEIGTILSKTVGDKTYHALVCHSLHDGWGDNQRETIKECFDKIPANGEPIATIAIGTGLVGLLSGASFRQIVCGMHDSEQQVILHGNYSLDAVLECYNEEKANVKVKKPGK
jgi:O-acetyl-ADP-ribose deacetylase (regulator of RNase III)